MTEKPGISTEEDPPRSKRVSRFEHIDLSWIPPSDIEDSRFERAFMNYAEGERVGDFRPLLHASLTRPLSRLLGDDGRHPVAILGEESVDQALRITLFRVAKGPHSEALALQLARQLRQDAVASRLQEIRVVDPRLPRAIYGALREDGFLRTELGELIARPISLQTSMQELRSSNAIVGTDVGTQLPSWRDLEWMYWPLMVLDESSPWYVIPIKPSAAMELFAYPRNLLQQKRALGLSRRHVYFRSGRSNPITEVPARVLWYASSEGRSNVHEFFATSIVTASHLRSVTEAHEGFGLRGTYKRSQIAKVADARGLVNVVEVEDTRLLRRTVGLHDFRRVAEPIGVHHIFQSPRRIPSDLAIKLMLEFNVPEDQ